MRKPQTMHICIASFTVAIAHTVSQPSPTLSLGLTSPSPYTCPHTTLHRNYVTPSHPPTPPPPHTHTQRVHLDHFLEPMLSEHGVHVVRRLSPRRVRGEEYGALVAEIVLLGLGEMGMCVVKIWERACMCGCVW